MAFAACKGCLKKEDRIKVKVENIIYIYGAICASMILFNTVYNLHLKRDESRLEKRRRKLKEKIDLQLERLRNGESVEESHLTYLKKKLGRVGNLIAFKLVCNEGIDPDTSLRQAYFNQIFPAIVDIAAAYCKKEDMQASYFAYFISGYEGDKQLLASSLQDLLLDYMKRPNLYCRFNTLKALYSFADSEHIVRALKLQDDNTVFVHEKLLTEGLLSYEGSHEQLIHSLFLELPEFTVHTQLSILNYIRFYSSDYKEEMYGILTNEKLNKELRLSAVRYFGKYAYEPARKHLASFVADRDSTRWEYAAVAASALSSYPGEDTTELLKGALHSSNWYVRNSAAHGLESMGINYTDVIDVMLDNDRYAREMIMYHLQSRKLQLETGG